MIMMAIMLPMLIGFVGIVSDAGIVYVMKADLQSSVDAAALAGAHELPVAADAIDIACDYIDLNAVSGMTGDECALKADVETSGSGPDTITVTSHRVVPSIFMTIVGELVGVTVAPKNVEARAIVKIGSSGKECIFPLFVEFSSRPTPDEKYAATVFTEPDAALIDDDNPNNGANAIRDTMADPCTFNGESAIGDEMDIKGGSQSQFKDGWVQMRDAALDASSACPNRDLSVYLTASDDLIPEPTFANCPRLRLVPVVPDGDYSGGDAAEILGFVPFYFGDFCEDNAGCTYSTGLGDVTVPNNRAFGFFLDMQVNSGTYVDYDEFGTKIIVMTG
jgi:hypothetical protein